MSVLNTPGSYYATAVSVSPKSTYYVTPNSDSVDRHGNIDDPLPR